MSGPLAVAADAAPAPPGVRLRRLDLAAIDTDPSARADHDALVRRGAVPDPTVREAARQILRDIREGGDDAVRAANARVGGGRPDGRLLLEPAELRTARDRLESSVRHALEHAIANVREFAETQLPTPSTRTVTAPGVEIERRWRPLDRIGAYVPGGGAAYPSSLVMTVVPARVAKVGTIVVASPADASGAVDPVLLGAAGLLEVDAFVIAGGAQAVGALAYGLPGAGLAPVDRIVGPGNAWVTAAKMELTGDVGIDLPAGPSEGMVIADETADIRFVAADLITQAEHGPDSPAILVTTSRSLAAAIESEISRQLTSQPRRVILERALADHGRIVTAPDLDVAIDFVNAYGPEHLSIELREADLERAVDQVQHAGSVFVGRWAPESAGDYATGANHVLPTGGLARSCGALDVSAYGKYVQVQRIDRQGLESLRSTIAALADAEGLQAHRSAVEIRFDERSEPDPPPTGPRP